MDRSFSNSFLGSRSPYSPRSRQNVSTKRLMAQQSFRKSSRLSLSGRSTQSVQIVLKSQANCVERFGQPLPVLITEALTFADRNTVVSARISSECGYAWLVCGRRLLVWQYRQSVTPVQLGTPRRGGITNQCYEMQLPQSDLAHRAELISVFLSSGSTAPSCIAVSPEGVIRYWPAVAHEGTFVEHSIDLHGQECDSLTSIESMGCILATTTCTVVLVQPNISSGRHQLTCHTLKMPSGWLGGLSKRMSSLIFGPINSEQTAETRLVRVHAVPTAPTDWIVYVLAGHSLQKWQLSATQAEHLISVVDLTRMVREAFYETIWENNSGDHSEMDTWILDLKADIEGNVVMLAAAVNMHQSPQIHYAIVNVEIRGAVPPTQLRSFSMLKMSGLYREDNPNDSLGYRFLLVGGVAYIFNHRCITVVKQQEEPDCLEFNAPQDFLLGGSICVNTPVFFSRNHGLVAVCTNDSITDLNMSTASQQGMLQADTSLGDEGVENLTLYSFNPDEIYTAYKDTVGQIKAAFIFHAKSQTTACNDILNELFLAEGAVLPGIDTVLDKVVVSVSKDLIDDIPANDSRWLDDNQVGLGSSYAMQVLQQLEDKRTAHAIYIKFLKDTELWQKLTAVTLRDVPLATVRVLSENSEKIVTAIALKSLQMNAIIEKAMEKVVANCDTNSDSGLTNQDLFYRQISKVHKIINELVNNCEEAVHTDINPLDGAKLISDTNSIILHILKEVMLFRQQYGEYFMPSSTAVKFAPDNLPWTGAAGQQGLLDALLSQQSLTYNYGAKVTSDYNLSSLLYEQLVTIIDFILDSKKNHLESVRGTPNEQILLKQYEIDRHTLIKPLVDDAQWEGAAALAEKYLDFECLLIICEKTDNQARLDEYMDRFSSNDFGQFVYSWYLKENKQGKLIDHCRRKDTSHKNSQQLRRFLSQHPSLSWIQHAFDRQYDDAAETLYTLAEMETDSVTRQKTMLSMAKLAKLASGRRDLADPFIENINNNLDIIGYQEDVPDYVLQQFGYDTLKPSVIAPKDLIHLYTCTEYRDATEVEFKKAIDLLPFVTDDELRAEINLQIWRNAVLRDSWDEKNLDCPLEILQNKLMFKIVDLLLVLGADNQTILPPLDVLIDDSEFDSLQYNKSFQYLIKTGYEHVLKS